VTTVQRPDQRLTTTTPGTVPGSRSGAAESALALNQVGVPPVVPGLLSASSIHQPTGTYTVITFSKPGQVWGTILSYAIVTNASFSGTTKNFATLATASNIQLGAVELTIGNASHEANGQSPPLQFGLNVAQGDSIILSVNGGNVVTNCDQRASAIVFYTLQQALT
jgi:hypothetical protein